MKTSMACLLFLTTLLIGSVGWSQDTSTMDVTVAAVDMAGGPLAGTITFQVQGGSTSSATGSGTWSIQAGAMVRFSGTWGWLATGATAYMKMEADTTIRMDAATRDMTVIPTPGIQRIEVVFEPIQVTGVVVDPAGDAITNATIVFGTSGNRRPSPFVWTMASGGQIHINALWGGLKATGYAGLPILKNTTYFMDALTGVRSEVSTPGATRVEFVFEPIAVTGVTVDLEGNLLNGSVYKRVHDHGGNSADSPRTWIMANGGRVSRSGTWGGLKSPGIGYEAVYKDTTYVEDALTGERSETSSPGVTRLETVFEPILVTGATVDLAGNPLNGTVYKRVYGYGGNMAASPRTWVMANGGKVGRSGVWGGLTSPGTGYLPVYKDTTHSEDALTGQLLQVSTPGETRVHVVFEPILVTLACVNGTGLPLPGQGYLDSKPYSSHPGWYATPLIRQMANGGWAAFAGTFRGFPSDRIRTEIFKDETVVLDGLTGEHHVNSSPGLNRVEIVYSFNEPPSADAGPDRVVEANAVGGALVGLDGTASTDDGELLPLGYVWVWTGGSEGGGVVQIYLPLGVSDVSLTVDDGEFTDTDVITVTVQDTTAPELECPGELLLEAGMEGNAEAYAVWLASAMASDICDADVSVVHDAPEWSHVPIEGVEGPGTTITWTATDDSGNTSSCSAVIKRLDTTPPEVSVDVTPEILWPPNHKLITIVVSVTAEDLVDPSPVVALLSVTSNEPDDVHGTGDGSTDNDIQGAEIGAPDFEILLRAERAAAEEGRVYTLVYLATDACGNSSTGSAQVMVPHDVGVKGRNCKQ